VNQKGYDAAYQEFAHASQAVPALAFLIFGHVNSDLWTTLSGRALFASEAA